MTGFKPLAFSTAMLGGAVVWLLATAATFGAAGAGTEAPPDIRGYHNWTRVNPTPYHVSNPAALLCAAPQPGSRPISPHDERYITVYVNSAARQAMVEARRPQFPIGSIIVKEKRVRAIDSTLELMTVMEKKPQGFDPKHGDWQYSVFDGKGKLYADAKVDQCQNCHQKMKGADYVFRGYLPKELQEALK